MTHGLRRFLADYDMAMLRALAQARGVTLVSNRQTEAADQLARDLGDPASVQAALDQLSSGARDALAALMAAGGRFRFPQFARRFGPVRPLGPGRLEREAAWQAPVSPTEELLYLGLIFLAFDRDEVGPGEFAFVPEELLPLMPQPPQAPARAFVESVPPPGRAREGGQAFIHDLFVYLAHLQIHDVRPRADGRLGRQVLAALRRRLTSPDERRLAFLQHLAARLGFVSRREELLRLEAAPVKRWLAASTAAQLAELQLAWRDDPDWNDLRQVPGLAFDEGTGWSLRNDPVATRQALLALLARCPKDAWWSLPAFVAAVKEAHPDFQRPDGDYASWYVRDAATGGYLAGFQAWERVEGALITDLLTGPLFWLGAVALGQSDAGPVCRLTDAGLRLLSPGEPEPEAPPSPPIVVGADMTVELPPPINLYTRFQLERFADLVSESPCAYRLTAASLGRALDRGLRVEQVLAFLQQASTRPVPPRVVGQLRLWAGRFDSVSLEEVGLLEVKHERVLKELTLMPETRGLIKQVLSPTSALVRREDLPLLRQRLRAEGYLWEPPEAGLPANPRDEAPQELDR